MKREFTRAIEHSKEGIHVASHPPSKSQMIRGRGEYGLKREYIRIVVLPEEGIHADDGFLFHHVAHHPPLTPQMITRLCENDIPYKVNQGYTPEEDEIIRNNWKEFAEEYNIPLDHVLKFAGVGDREGEFDPPEVIDRRYFCENANFWPRMCNGLECRSGNQIKKRMQIIFDDAVVNGVMPIQYGKRKNGRILHLADLTNYVEAYPKCHYVQRETAKIIQVTRHKLKSTLADYLSIYGNVERKHWKCLWNTVDRLVQVFPITKTFNQNYRKAIMRRDCSELRKLTKSINFQRIGNVMLKNFRCAKKAWNELTEELLNEYIRSYDRVKIGAIAFEEACNKIFSERAFISPDRFSLFLRLLPQCIKDNKMSKTKMKKKYFHMDRLAKMLLDYGISGFHVYDPSMSEAECIYSHAKIYLTECDTEVLSKVDRIFTLKEKIQLFTTAYEMQFHHIAGKNLYPIEGEACQNNYVITKDGYLCFKMDDYDRVLRRYLAKENPNNSDSDNSGGEDITD